MFSSLSQLFSTSAITGVGSPLIDDAPLPVKLIDLDKDQDKRTRALRHFIKLNHAEYALVEHNSSRVNTLSDALTTALVLGAGEVELEDIFEKEVGVGSKWADAPSEISAIDWMDFLGQKSYQRAFLDFFEDQVVELGYDWEEVVKHFLFGAEPPLFDDAMAADGQAIIRLANAMELSSREMAMEALTLFAVCRNVDDDVPKLVHMSPAQTSDPSLSLVEILGKVREDSQLRNRHSSAEHGILLEYWQLWTESNAKEQLFQVQHLAAALILSVPEAPSELSIIAATSHALRSILAMIPAKSACSALKQWWLRALHFYLNCGCPKLVDTSSIILGNPPILDWKLMHQSVQGRLIRYPFALTQSLRALFMASKTWPKTTVFYLAARQLTTQYGLV